MQISSRLKCFLLVSKLFIFVALIEIKIILLLYDFRNQIFLIFSMGSFLDKPKTEKTNESGQGNDLSYGVSAMQGWRIEMEDAHTHLIGLPLAGFENWSFFAVFDGHAGGTVSRYSSKELIYSILNADPELFNELASIYGSTVPTVTNDGKLKLLKWLNIREN